VPIVQHSRQRIVTVGINIGADDDFLADSALDGEASAVNLRLYALDDDTGRQSIRQTVHRFTHHHEIPSTARGALCLTQSKYGQMECQDIAREGTI